MTDKMYIICEIEIDSGSIGIEKWFNNLEEAKEHARKLANNPFYEYVIYKATQSFKGDVNVIETDLSVPTETPKPKFKVGDVVKITSGGAKYDHTDGFSNVWLEDGMDKYINDGKEYTVINVCKIGIRLIGITEYHFPPQSLSHIDPTSDKPSQVEQFDKHCTPKREKGDYKNCFEGCKYVADRCRCESKLRIAESPKRDFKIGDRVKYIGSKEICWVVEEPKNIEKLYLVESKFGKFLACEENLERAE